MHRLLLAALVALAPIPISAQNLSVEDITGLIDAKQSEMAEYRALLNDPEPERARMAMKIMLEKGDDELKRLALEQGLYSTDPGVRRVALEGFLRSKPFLTIRADGEEADKNDNYDLRNALSDARGTIDSTGKIVLNHQLGEFDEEAKCIPYANTNICAFRISDAAIAMRHFGRWTELALDTDGVLRGEIYIKDVGTLSAEIPISQ